MKQFIFFAHACTWFVVAFQPRLILAQDTVTAYPNYVVIGAFAYHKNAVQFTADANRNEFTAKFEMNPNRNLYYVYVLTTDDREYAFAEALKLREQTKYFDTWVYSGALGSNGLARSTTQAGDFNPETRLQIGGPAAEETRDRLNSGSPLRSQSSNNRTSRSGPDKSSPDVPQLPDPGQQTTAGSITTKKTGTKTGNNTQTPGRQTREQRNTDAAEPLSDEATDRPEAQQSLTDANPSSQHARQTSDGGVQNIPATSGVDRPSLPDAGKVTSTTREPLQSSDDAPVNGATTAKENPAVKNNNDSQVLGPPPQRATSEPLEKEEVVGKNFYFHLFRADNRDMVPGEVDAIDFEKARRMATYDANIPVKVIMPSGKTKQVSFVCQVFGYRKHQREFDPNDPAEDFYLDDKGNVVVPFELVRLQKGDIAIMYNVFFFKDAAVMRPESRYEVNNLLDLLVENPSYRIVIHGHTNGNASGKIIRMDKPGNFYSLSGTKQGFGSAKQLSEERAIVIRDFLISSGIAADRMDVKAWGGKKPIHDKHAVRANENVRVEIEILSD